MASSQPCLIRRVLNPTLGGSDFAPSQHVPPPHAEPSDAILSLLLIGRPVRSSLSFLGPQSRILSRDQMETLKNRGNWPCFPTTLLILLDILVKTPSRLHVNHHFAWISGIAVYPIQTVFPKHGSTSGVWTTRLEGYKLDPSVMYLTHNLSMDITVWCVTQDLGRGKQDGY